MVLLAVMAVVMIGVVQGSVIFAVVMGVIIVPIVDISYYSVGKNSDGSNANVVIVVIGN